MGARSAHCCFGVRIARSRRALSSGFSEPFHHASRISHSSALIVICVAADSQRQAAYDPENLPDEDPFLRWIATLSKKEAKEIERGVKKIITDIVRALGGSEQTGGRLLLPAIEHFQIGDHSIRSLRLPADSAATQMTSSELEVEILEAWWTGSENPELGARKLRAILTPKQQ